MKYPNTKGLIVRKTYPELLSNHIRMFMTEYPEVVNWYKQGEKAIYWPNGSLTEFSHLGGTNDVYIYQGREYEDISIDEITQHEELVFKILRSSNRTANKEFVKAGGQVTMLLTGNPGGIGHGWVKRIFIDKLLMENENPEDFGFVQAKVWDNKALMDADPDYLRRLKDLPKDLMRAYLEGDWDVFAGQVFSEWRKELHVCNPITPRQEYPHFLWVDWGYSGAESHEGAFAAIAGALVSEKYQGIDFNRVIVYKEWYGKFKHPKEWAEIIYEESPRKYKEGVGDAAMFNNQTDGSKPIAKLMEDEWNALNKGYWLTMKPGTRNRLARVATLHNWLSIAPDGLPYMLITESCPNLIRTLPLLVHDPHKVEDVDSSLEDHCLVGDTQILTDKGWKYIMDIPESKVTAYDATVIDLVTSSGRKLSCTKNHKVLTTNGWKEAGSLKIGEEILLLSQIPYKSFLEDDSTNAENTTVGNPEHLKETKDYIGRCGYLTTVPFQKDTQFTTKTETSVTTQLKTSSYLRGEGTLGYIPLNLQTSKDMQEEETPLNLQHRVMQSLPKNGGVEHLSWVGNERKVDKVYDLGVEHPSHCFIANGFIVHNCYDALTYGLSAVKFIPANLGGISKTPDTKKALPALRNELDLSAFEQAKITKSRDWRVA